jgi:hypothetical protein
VRTAFLVLLSVNLLFLAWAHWIDSPHEANSQDGLSKLPRLKLVTEAPPGPKPTSASAQKMAFHEAPSPSTVCTSVGPFYELASAARAAGMLHDLGLTPRQRAEEGETLEGYWVFVGGMQSDDEVAQVAQKLDMSGFTDAHVMKPSLDGRRVSVGLFSQRDRAERRAKAVQHIGLDPQIAERKFPGTVYWVDVGLQPGAKELHAPGLLSQVGYKNAGIQPCPPRMHEHEDEVAPEPRDDGITRSLPRTTVASAPKPN